jgi:hypothetical protein
MTGSADKLVFICCGPRDEEQERCPHGRFKRVMLGRNGGML